MVFAKDKSCDPNDQFRFELHSDLCLSLAALGVPCIPPGKYLLLLL